MSKLRENHPSAITELHLTGNPGCGKTQLARLCAEDLIREKQFQCVITLDVKNDALLEDSYKNFLQKFSGSMQMLNNREFKALGIIQRLRKLCNLVSKKMRQMKDMWLIIIDNLENKDEMELLIKFLPNCNSKSWGVGQIIFTSQLEDFAQKANPKVKTLSLKNGLKENEAEAIDILKKISNKEGTEETLLEVCKMLDFQPLSLAHAALEVFYTNSLTWEAYIKTFKTRSESNKDSYYKESNYLISMIDSIIGCVQRMRENDNVLKYIPKSRM